MDPSDLDPEMAAFMGFSSFGTQPSAKKRKFNHRTDAVASADSATGANQTALAERPQPRPQNTDEIALDQDLETPAESEPRAEEGTAGGEQGEEKGSLYTDPAIAPALAHAQQLINELAEKSAPAPAAGHSLPQPPSLPLRPDASWGREVGTAPTSMPAWSQDQSRSHGHGHRGGRGGYQAGQRSDGKPWWEGYYDTKSNENPWERLEKKMGVEPRGSWSLKGEVA
ncbi:hypothetical protein C8034_v011084 [Colletotrichum sidae]|uniref:Uncharacterized protein n=1 Tax=Colletotrichum sidae TaxID=1347389 RepID=A0A4R8TIY3_9PEZI|nr:hypothetical protein C8034_v011084 [Colletotrichum sidae]